MERLGFESHTNIVIPAFQQIKLEFVNCTCVIIVTLYVQINTNILRKIL
jgi:hypothetical protein